MQAKVGLNTRIYSGYVAVLLVLAGIVTVSVSQLSAITAEEARGNLYEAQNIRVHSIQIEAQKFRRAILRIILDNDDKAHIEVLRSREAAVQLLRDAIAGALSAERKAMFEDALGHFIALEPKVVAVKAAAQALKNTKQGLLDAGEKLAMKADLVVMHTTKNGSDLAEAAFDLKVALATLRIANWRFLAMQDQSGVANFKRRAQEVDAALERYDQNFISETELNPAAELRQVIKTYIESFSTASATVLDMNNIYRNNVVPAVEKATALLDTAIASLERDSNKVRGETTTLLKSTWQIQIWGGAAAVLLGVAIAVFVARSITRPLFRLVAATRALSHGDYGNQVPEIERRDELGDVARALDIFKASGIERQNLEREAREQQARIEADRVRADAERTAIAAEQAQVVKEIGEGLERLSKRDLTHRLAALPDAYKKLENDFNAAMGALGEAMSVVAQNSATMLTGSREVSQSADDLSKRTEQQAASLEETAAALDEITATGKKAAEGASHAREVASKAKTDAEAAGQVVRKTVEAIGDIEKSAQQINQIIGVIDEIAFQTNLLALNAGVEAARAGEAGRGFAVVASEVRALAQRSAEAAKEIKGLISTSTEQVSTGVRLVADTGAALERILAQVNDINTVIGDIAAGAQEQATGLAQVNSAINQMDQTTQQNAAMVEETTAASHSLAHEATQLAEIIGQFSGVQQAGYRGQSAQRVKPRNAKANRGRDATALAVKTETSPAGDWADF